MNPEPDAPVSLRIGGLNAELLFRGQAPGTAGVMQINARVPAVGIATEAGVILRIGGAESPAGLVIAVR